MNTYPIPKRKEITFYHLLSKQLLLLIDQENHYCIFDLSQNKVLFDYQPLVQALNTKNLRAAVALPYFALAEDYGQKGLLLSIENPNYHYAFERGDYHVEQCCFPLALYQENNQFHLLHGSDWNRIEQINITINTSLIPKIADGEEDDHEIDYFHSSIQLSPNKQEFLSNGWVWAPYDLIYRFKLKKLQEGKSEDFQCLELPVSTGYNWDRPLCWINNNLVAVGYNPREDDDEILAKNTSSEIIIYDLSDDAINKKIRTDSFVVNEHGEVWGDLYYHKKIDAFISINGVNGLEIIKRNGQSIYSNPQLKNWQYSANLNLIYYLNEDQLYISSIENLLS